MQICSGSDPWANLFLASAFIDEAESLGCDLLCFPENIFYRGPRKSLSRDIFLKVENQSLEPSSDFSAALLEVVKGTKLALSFGSLLEVSEDPERPFNAHWFVLPGGEIFSYRKIHLFSFQGEKASYDESQSISPGDRTQVVNFGGFRIGLSICYDLRFPELYRELAIKERADLY